MRQRLTALRRAGGALLACLGLAATLLAATGGSRADDAAGAVLAAARSHLGEPYVWGAAGPKSWDCSGFTSTLWRDAGGVRRVPRVAADQQAWAVPIPVEQALPGDLVFFGYPATHVGIVWSRWHGDVTMIDASSSQHGVVLRQVWKTGIVRFGRVPRPHMPEVTPFVPEPLPTPTPTATPPAGKPGSTPATPSVPAAQGVATGLPGLPQRQAGPSAPQAVHLATLMGKAVGATGRTDVELVRTLWRAAAGADLPADRDKLVAAGRAVPVKDARIGDLVVYPAPTSHVGVYVGGGLMVDASRILAKVVRRPVWAGPGLTLVRLKV